MDDNTRGLYEKFTVIRNDGKDAPGQKHHGCQYFVLDLDHDPHARAALEAYKKSCQNEYPTLAADIRALLYGCEFGGIPNAERSAVETSLAPFRHWEKDVAVPYAGCICATCEDWRKQFVGEMDK